MQRYRKLTIIVVPVVAVFILVGLYVPLSPTQNQISQAPVLTVQSKVNQTCTLSPSLVEVEDAPQETEGPYFVDELLDRSDIRSDPGTGIVEQGLPLRMQIHVYDIDNGTCNPVKGAQVDIWHANSQGLYSDEQQLGTGGKKFLRGYQNTDSNGQALFTTVYPGWYEGRAIHMHIKIRIFSGTEKTFEWTSQFYFPDSINNIVHTQPPYSNHGKPPVSDNEDGIYTGPSTDGTMQSDTGAHLMPNMTKDGNGYLGTFNVGINLSK